MQQLLQAVLSDSKARSSDKLPKLAAKSAEQFLPWASIAEE